MKPLHLVMNPRWIPECMDAFAALDIDTCYLRGMTQEQLVPHVARVIEETDHDPIVMTSDDARVEQAALDAVLALIEAGHPAATGWCRLDRTHELVNLTSEPLRGDVPRNEAYTLMSYDDVISWPDEVVPTGLMGMGLTAMPRELWQRFPFQVYGVGRGGWASDFNLCVRLRDAGIPMVAARSGYIDHRKERWGHPDTNPQMRLLIGEIEPEVVMVTAKEAA